MMNASVDSDLQQLSNQAVEPFGSKVIRLFLYAVVFVLTVGGNILVCTVVMKNRKLRSMQRFYYGYFLMNLALADLAVALLCIPFTVVYYETGVWPFGALMCKLVPTLQVTSVSASIFTLTVMTYERYLAIVRPLKAQISKRKVLVMLTLVWFFAFISASPELFAYEFHDNAHHKFQCRENWPHQHYRRGYTMVLFVGTYLVPLMVIFPTYVKMLSTLKKSHLFNNTDKKQRWKSLRVLIAVVIIFASSYLPQHVMFLAMDFGNGLSFRYFEITLNQALNARISKGLDLSKEFPRFWTFPKNFQCKFLDISKEFPMQVSGHFQRFSKGTKAETSLRQAVKLFEIIFNDLQVDGQQISLVDREIDTYKMLFKVLVDMGKHIDALLVAERCRAKALKYRLILKHKTIEDGLAEDEVTTNDIRTLVITGNYAILFYTWCFNDLYIFLVQNTKDDNGEDEVLVHVQYYKNFRKVLNAEIINAFGQINVAAALDSYANRREDVEEDQDESTCRDYCCGAMRAGLPSENDDHSNYGGTTSTSSDACRSLESLEKLHQWLLSPFLSKITAPEIVIIPEGSLYLLPFAALRDPATKRYLSQDKRLRFSPSLTNLTLHHRVPEDYYSHSGSLIIGDPTNDEIPELIDLPGSRKEAERIAELIGGVHPLIGRQATKSAVLERLPEVCIVHLACHICLSKSVIILAPNDDTEGAPIDEDAYLLKGEEVMKTKVRARLVVLSGCNSGRGKVSAEGVVGIARAFLAAGACAVLVSRWKVDDNTTCEFMETFYTYLLDWDQQRRSASESLHLTINDMRKKYPHDPMKWSGFFLMGDDVTTDRERLSVLRETNSRPSVSRHSWEFPS
ncbi:hypothetical protein QZH41_001498 [Actinostola sp. cb2023]|nr:hypothetical protein QZH41_001498 [Actinostola sp. cb2023]